MDAWWDMAGGDNAPGRCLLGAGGPYMPLFLYILIEMSDLDSSVALAGHTACHGPYACSVLYLAQTQRGGSNR